MTLRPRIEIAMEMQVVVIWMIIHIFFVKVKQLIVHVVVVAEEWKTIAIIIVTILLMERLLHPQIKKKVENIAMVPLHMTMAKV